MTNKELKKNARIILYKKWLKAAAATSIYTLLQLSLTMLINYLTPSHFLVALCLLIIGILLQVPFTYGLITSFINLKENKKFAITDFITIAIDNIGISWSLALKIIEKMFIPIILILVLLLATHTLLICTTKITTEIIYILILLIAIIILCLIWLLIEGISYTLSYIIKYKNPKYTIKKVFEENKKLILENSKQLTQLILSIIGWIVLGVITFGITNLWVIPYIIITLILFYEDTNKSKRKKIKKDEKITSDTTTK